MQVIDALFSNNISTEIRSASLAFLAVGGLSLVMSILEMGLFIWSGKCMLLLVCLYQIKPESVTYCTQACGLKCFR